jgi:hypothetical protein
VRKEKEEGKVEEWREKRRGCEGRRGKGREEKRRACLHVSITLPAVCAAHFRDVQVQDPHHSLSCRLLLG